MPAVHSFPLPSSIPVWINYTLLNYSPAEGQSVHFIDVVKVIWVDLFVVFLLLLIWYLQVCRDIIFSYLTLVICLLILFVILTIDFYWYFRITNFLFRCFLSIIFIIVTNFCSIPSEFRSLLMFLKVGAHISDFLFSNRKI